MLKRLTLASFLALAVTACAPSGDRGEDAPSNTPFGYEFAQIEATQIGANGEAELSDQA